MKDTKAMAKAARRAERAAERAKPKKEKGRVKSLAQMAEDKIIKNLSESLDVHARSATFAWGGNILFKSHAKQSQSLPVETCSEDASDSKDASLETDTLPTVDDVYVRFGPNGKGSTVVFNANGVSDGELEQLLLACQPAFSGRGSEAVLDEKYRKAGKLDRTEFATTFCPYEAGIIDVVSQLLVPQYKHGEHTRSIKVPAQDRSFLVLRRLTLLPG